jgi:uncharacterized short protein YbdD (DUF466 family)
MKINRLLKQLLSRFNGNDEYQKYLQHFKQNYQRHNHMGQNPLSRRQFFAQKEDKKWSKINRCC